MADFKLYYPKLQNHEGGYANNPKDAGGETYAGVARNFWPRWPGWKRIDAEKSQWPENTTLRQLTATLNKRLASDAILQDMIFQFYKVNFWNSLQLDFVKSQPLAEQLADMGVNSGPMRPGKMIQKLVNDWNNFDPSYKPLAVDGDIGPKTIEYINREPAPVLYKNFVQMRKEFYYYRVGQLENVTAANEKFFAQELNLRSKPDQIGFLKSWLSRCAPATI